jgi:hypothetical protein
MFFLRARRRCRRWPACEKPQNAAGSAAGEFGAECYQLRNVAFSVVGISVIISHAAHDTTITEKRQQGA